MSCKLEKPHPYIFILGGLFILQFLFISPIGEFALNDDWVHTEILKNWLDSGTFRMNPFAGPAFYSLIILGLGLVKMLGFTFSFSLLRIFTLILAFFTLILFYKFLVRISEKPTLSFLFTLLLWLNPIFYNLSFTFMTDIPALFLLMAGIYAYYLGFTEKKYRWLFLGSTLAVVGMYTRQTNILLLGAAGLYALIQLKQYEFKHLLWSFGVPLLAAIGIYGWLWTSNLLPPGTALHFFANTSDTLKHILWWSFYSVMYLGFFVTPLAFGWGLRNLREIKNKKLWLFVGGTVAVAIIIRHVFKLQFPYVLNIVNVYGLGPMQGVLNGSLVPLLPSKVWGIITVIVAASGGWVLYVLSNIKNVRQKFISSPLSFVYIFSIVFIIPILLLESFDRYYLPLFITLAIVFVQVLKKIECICIGTYIGIAVFGFWSISQTSFYMEWNAARWDMAHTILEESELQVHNIDAGYEWNGWHAYWSAYAAQQQGTKNGPWGTPWWIYHLFVNNTQDYIISFSPIPPYDVIEERIVPGHNPNNKLYLLKKPAELYE